MINKIYKVEINEYENKTNMKFAYLFLIKEKLNFKLT